MGCIALRRCDGVWQIFLAHFAEGGQDRQLCRAEPGRLSHAQEPIMEPKLSREAYVRAMRQRVEQTLGAIADAVNEAEAGKIITDSEEKVRDLFARLRQEAFEQAVQMRVDAAEAAFPPSEGPSDAQVQAQ
jgi:hypothetical protein